MTRAVALCAIVALFACTQGSGAVAFGSAPFASTTSTACDARFDAYSAPDPFARGEGEVAIVATSLETNAPIDGLAVSVVPFMPAMGHGATTDPVVTAQGNGKYLATGVILPMPGVWQIRAQIGGACTDALVFNLNVQ